mgnify:CR=1 FL=1
MSKTLVMKFGGTSVGSVERIRVPSPAASTIARHDLAAAPLSLILPPFNVAPSYPSRLKKSSRNARAFWIAVAQSRIC